MGIFRNKKSTLTSSLEVLKIFYRFTDIEPLFGCGNLFPFFNLKSEYFMEFFTFLTFACNFNLAAGNLVYSRKAVPISLAVQYCKFNQI